MPPGRVQGLRVAAEPREAARAPSLWGLTAIVALVVLVGCLAALWQDLATRRLDGAATPAASSAGRDDAALDGCMEVLARAWRALTPAQRTNDLDMQPLRSTAAACVRPLGASIAVYVIDARDRVLQASLHGRAIEAALPWRGAVQHPPALPLARAGRLAVTQGPFVGDRLQRVYGLGPSLAGGESWLVVDGVDDRPVTSSSLPMPPAALRWQLWLGAAALAAGLAMLAGWLALNQSHRLQRAALEQQLRERQRLQASAEAEVRFRRDVFEAVGVGLRVVDPQGRLVEVNPAFCAASGWSAPDLIGRLPPYPFWPQQAAGPHADYLRAVLEGQSNPLGYQVDLVRPDGTPWMAHVIARALSDGQGWILASTDITQERLDRRRMDALNEELRRVSSVSLLGQRAGELLHQFSNHCGTALHALSAARKQFAAQRFAAAGEAVDLGLETVNALGRLVERFRPWLRDEVSLEAVHLHDVAQDAVLQEAGFAQQHHTVLSNQVAPALPVLMLDRMALCEVLSNLIHNAVMAMQETPLSNRRVVLDSYLDEARSEVLLRVCDLGPGIPVEWREAVFERGFTTRLHGAQRGSGWGLSNCRYWVRKCGGDIDIADHQPRGTAVQIRLPYLNRSEAVQASEDARHG